MMMFGRSSGAAAAMAADEATAARQQNVENDSPVTRCGCEDVGRLTSVCPSLTLRGSSGVEVTFDVFIMNSSMS